MKGSTVSDLALWEEEKMGWSWPLKVWEAWVGAGGESEVFSNSLSTPGIGRLHTSLWPVSASDIPGCFHVKWSFFFCLLYTTSSATSSFTIEFSSGNNYPQWEDPQVQAWVTKLLPCRWLSNGPPRLLTVRPSGVNVWGSPQCPSGFRTIYKNVENSGKSFT